MAFGEMLPDENGASTEHLLATANPGRALHTPWAHASCGGLLSASLEPGAGG